MYSTSICRRGTQCRHPTESQRVDCIRFRGAVLLRWAGVGRIIATFYMLMSLKRRVRAAHGQKARPNPTSYAFMVLGVFKLMEGGGVGGGRVMLRRERNCVCVVAYATRIEKWLYRNQRNSLNKPYKDDIFCSSLQFSLSVTRGALRGREMEGLWLHGVPGHWFSGKCLG